MKISNCSHGERNLSEEWSTAAIRIYLTDTHGNVFEVREKPGGGLRIMSVSGQPLVTHQSASNDVLAFPIDPMKVRR